VNMTKGSDVSDILATLDKILTTPPEITLASADEGLEEVKMITQAIQPGYKDSRKN